MHCVPVRDYYNEPLWVQAVRDAVAAHVPEGASVALVGHFKDSSSSYLARPGWELISLPRLGQFDATPLREIFFGEGSASPQAMDAALTQLADQMPQSTLDFYATGHTSRCMRACKRVAYAAGLQAGMGQGSLPRCL